ncbi:hypothetical protein C8J57DRAFT_1516776 [Mycena rebaudengoi]|nr:hypothetical protein C8J57DRAFT_1516776 [Mycena rebaudengoi]
MPPAAYGLRSFANFVSFVGFQQHLRPPSGSLPSTNSAPTSQLQQRLQFVECVLQSFLLFILTGLASVLPLPESKGQSLEEFRAARR